MDQPANIKTFTVQEESGDVGVCMIVTADQSLSHLGIGFHHGPTKTFLNEAEYRQQNPVWDRPVIILQYLSRSEKGFGPLKPETYRTPDLQRALLISFKGSFEHAVSEWNRAINPLAAFLHLISMVGGILRNSLETGLTLEDSIAKLRNELPPEFVPNLQKILDFGSPIFMELTKAEPEISFGKICAQCPVNKMHLSLVLNQLLSEFIIIHPGSLPPEAYPGLSN